MWNSKWESSKVREGETGRLRESVFLNLESAREKWKNLIVYVSVRERKGLWESWTMT